jgi:hypothetical protein
MIRKKQANGHFNACATCGFPLNLAYMLRMILSNAFSFLLSHAFTRSLSQSFCPSFCSSANLTCSSPCLHSTLTGLCCAVQRRTRDKGQGPRAEGREALTQHRSIFGPEQYRLLIGQRWTRKVCDAALATKRGNPAVLAFVVRFDGRRFSRVSVEGGLPS